MKYIEKSWGEYRSLILKDVPQEQIDVAKTAFFSGAATIFYGIIRMLDPGTEPTDADMERMTTLQKEIDDFGQELDLKVRGLVRQQ